MPCNAVIMKQISSSTAGSGQTLSSLQGPKVRTECFLPQAIRPKIRTLLNQSEGRSELLPPLPQRNSTTETKKHPGAANSHHEPWPLASASTVQLWDEGRLDFPFGESRGSEGVGRLCVGSISFSLEFPSMLLINCTTLVKSWNCVSLRTAIKLTFVPGLIYHYFIFHFSWAFLLLPWFQLLRAQSVFNFAQNLMCIR